LRVDGGMTANPRYLQMQADMLGIPVLRPSNNGDHCAGCTIWPVYRQVSGTISGVGAALEAGAVFEPRIR